MEYNVNAEVDATRDALYKMLEWFRARTMSIELPTYRNLALSASSVNFDMTPSCLYVSIYSLQFSIDSVKLTKMPFT